MTPMRSDHSENTASASLVSLLVEYFRELHSASLDYLRADRQRRISQQRPSDLSFCDRLQSNHPIRRDRQELHAKRVLDEQLLQHLHQGQERRDCHSAANYTPYPDAAIFRSLYAIFDWPKPTNSDTSGEIRRVRSS